MLVLYVIFIISDDCVISYGSITSLSHCLLWNVYFQFSLEVPLPWLLQSKSMSGPSINVMHINLLHYLCQFHLQLAAMLG